MESMKEIMSFDLRFSLPDTKVKLKQLPEKYMSVKIHVIKRASTAKLCTVAFVDVLRNI